MKGISEVAGALRKYNNFLITSHINLEGDSAGSQLAMAFLLKRLGKKYLILDNDAPPGSLRFMLQGETIKTDLARSDRFDVILALDCPVVRRTGRVAEYFNRAKKVINIDHHVSNSNFGDIVWVEPDMSCCGEMMYYLYKAMGIKVDKKAALCMYVAILTDTGWFSYENTNDKTHKVVSELLKTGIKPLWVGKQLNEKKSLNEIKLLIEALKTIRLHLNDQIATMHTSQKMLKKFKVGLEGTENFVNYGRSINSAKVAIFFLEKSRRPQEVHVSFRSKGDVNVNEIAALFKGGGHPNASGCLIKGDIAQAEKIVLTKVKSFLKRK